MARKKSKNQVVVGISMENGIPRVRRLTAEEEKVFHKKHPNAKLPTFSLAKSGGDWRKSRRRLGRSVRNRHRRRT